LDIQIKKNLSYYAKGFYNSRELRQKIFRSSDPIENVIELFFKLFDRNVEKNKLEKISSGAGNMPAWLLSHPKTQSRIKAIEKLEQTWQK